MWKDNAIIFRSRGFKKAVSPCCQELRLPYYEINRFRGTDSLRLLWRIMMTPSLQDHVILVKYYSSLSGKAMLTKVGQHKVQLTPFRFGLNWMILMMLSCYGNNAIWFYYAKTFILLLKGALYGLRQFLITESPLKMTKNASYLTLKTLFVLKIFKFLSCLFVYVEKTAPLES